MILILNLKNQIEDGIIYLCYFRRKNDEVEGNEVKKLQKFRSFLYNSNIRNSEKEG